MWWYTHHNIQSIRSYSSKWNITPLGLAHRWFDIWLTNFGWLCTLRNSWVLSMLSQVWVLSKFIQVLKTRGSCRRHFFRNELPFKNIYIFLLENIYILVCACLPLLSSWNIRVSWVSFSGLISCPIDINGPEIWRYDWTWSSSQTPRIWRYDWI